MKPIDFKESNKVLGKPESMTDEECVSLPVFSDGVHCISCWEGTPSERLQFMATGKIYIGVMSGQTQPPIFISVQNPFEIEGEEDGN